MASTVRSAYVTEGPDLSGRAGRRTSTVWTTRDDRCAPPPLGANGYQVALEHERREGEKRHTCRHFPMPEEGLEPPTRGL